MKSFEHEIENRKPEYYSVLRNCQSQRPNENVSEWNSFYFDALKNVQEQLIEKLNLNNSTTQLSLREKSILTFIENNVGCKSGEISKKLGIPNPTVKRILSELFQKKFIEKKME